jgi:ABC-2 type transport system ATP-binding protein
VRLRAADDVGAGEFDIEGAHDVEVRAGDGGGEDGAAGRGGDDGVTEVRFTYTGDVNPLVDRVADYDLLDLDVEEAPLDEVFMRFYGGSDA